MALRVVELAEEGSFGAGRPAFARSQAYDVLTRELRRYLSGEIRGRSFLISGHRGSGKTSLVLRAVEDLVQDTSKPPARPARRLRGGGPQRPLLVKLHGPSLIPRAVVAEAAESIASDPTASEPGHPASAGAAEQVLIQITIALYRALANEMAGCYRKHALALATTRPLGDLVELAAQLQLELDDAPSPATLRAFWQRIGRLRTGVLSSPPVAVSFGSPASDRKLFSLPPWQMDLELSASADQGMREVVALSTAAQAYQVVSGAIIYETVAKKSAENEASLKSELKIDLKDLANALVGLTAGGLVGAAALFAQNWGLPGAVAAGIGTSLLTQWGLTWTTSRARSQSVSTEYRFLRDHSVQTLDRELPLVIERIREAGLAPVFLVDELDKIDGLETGMAQLVQRMKHLVADYSFFCFLTDRDYFEYLCDLSRREAYPREHTYFSHRLFVIYRPQHLHAYLDQLLRPVGTPQNTPAPGVRDTLGKRALAHLLLHRAMMHTFDLQRELARVCNEDGYVTLTADQLVTHLGYRFNIMVQLVIEQLLAEEEMRDRLDQDPLFAQLAYDALYYVSRNWLDGDGELDVGDKAIDGYLAARLKDRRKAQQAVGPEAVPISDMLGPPDRSFLIDKIRRIAELLAHPHILQSVLYARPDLDDVGRQLIETIPAGEEIRLLSGRQEPRVYRWHRDAFGRRLINLEEPSVTPERQEADHALIEDVTRWLADLRLSPTALAESGILRTSPAWSQIEEARTRLKQFSEDGRSYDEIELDQVIVHEFAAMLAARGFLLAASLIVAGVIARDAGMNVRAGIRAGMEALGRALAFRSVDETAALEALKNYTGRPWIADPPSVRLERHTFEDWRDHIERQWKLIEDSPRAFEPQVARALAWQSWRTRLRENLPVPQRPQAETPDGYYSYPIPEHAELVVDAARRSPGKLLHWDLSQMTVSEWSRLLVHALNRTRDESDPEYVPLWVAFPVLWYLGLGDLESRLRELLDEADLVHDWPTRSELPLPQPPITISQPLLLLARAEHSLADASPPLPERAVLAVRQSEITAGASFVRLIPTDRIAALVIEHEGRLDEGSGAISLPPDLMSVRRFDTTEQPYDSSTPPSPHQLYGIRSLGELVKQITLTESGPAEAA